jgi:cytochrome c
MFRALATLGILSCLAMPVFASKELATASNCMGCHASDKKLVGPSYQDIVKKYGGQKDAAATLAATMRAGSTGKWGAIAMPANPALTPEKAKTLAQWILDGAK